MACRIAGYSISFKQLTWLTCARLPGLVELHECVDLRTFQNVFEALCLMEILSFFNLLTYAKLHKHVYLVTLLLIIVIIHTVCYHQNVPIVFLCLSGCAISHCRSSQPLSEQNVINRMLCATTAIIKLTH
jgi:hypothetical protein